LKKLYVIVSLGHDWSLVFINWLSITILQWLGFGPEQLSIPRDFELPVSSFAQYGGHASIHVRCDSKTTAPLYRIGDDTPGNNIAFLQVGVPGYRVSQMQETGGKILDAYGLVNVVSPSGLPLRGIVGISPDPIMLLAINCKDVKESKAFYEQLGFVEQVSRRLYAY
jgi:hypothetical protein